jgi:hypothetical protein
MAFCRAARQRNFACQNALDRGLAAEIDGTGLRCIIGMD